MLAFISPKAKPPASEIKKASGVSCFRNTCQLTQVDIENIASSLPKTKHPANFSHQWRDALNASKHSNYRDFFDAHFLEQYFTASQFNLHFFLQLNGKLHVTHTFHSRFFFINTLVVEVLGMIGSSGDLLKLHG